VSNTVSNSGLEPSNSEPSNSEPSSLEKSGFKKSGLENPLRSTWANNQAVINGWLHIPDSFASEVMAHAGWDSLTLDAQHGPFEFSSAVSMIQAIQTTRTAVVARVAWNDPGTIMKYLDAGVHAIICPMVNTQAECEAFIGACRYPPQGFRSYGPTRAALHFGAEYAANANGFVVTIPMIETAQALENLEQILSVPGVDAIFVGPGDLGQALYGKAQIDRETPEFLVTLERIARTARAKGIQAGIFTGSVAYAKKMIEIGYNFVTISSDARLLATAAKQVLNEIKNESYNDSKTEITPATAGY
jgi:4-hydroxy-2-oxoheptanedioate aldolase